MPGPSESHTATAPPPGLDPGSVQSQGGDQGPGGGIWLDPETGLPVPAGTPGAVTPMQFLGTLGIGTEDGAKKIDPLLAAGERAYFQIWGTKPPKGYIKSLADQGLNVNEIILNELQKPAARKTFFYRNQYAQFASQLAQLMGARP
jgi:hypothetical protein